MEQDHSQKMSVNSKKTSYLTNSRKQFGENNAQIPKMTVYKCLFSF
ncbi:hypothetical protein LEMLEM_LOCUS3907 [Lemmus lemmus]